MLKKVKIENFKSIDELELDLGQINIFIGQNGSGKSNILESIALGAAAISNKLDNECLAPRGIRVTKPQFMYSAFKADNLNKEIRLSFHDEEDIEIECMITCSKTHYPKWHISHFSAKSVEKEAFKVTTDLPNFIVYHPQYSSLRIFEKECQIQPLGINGEGLFKLLKFLNSEPEKIKRLKEKMESIGWFEDLEIPSNLYASEQTLKITDIYLESGLFFDQKSVNEGFLFLLFYFSLFISDDTPKFFAIDNIDGSLNPKLCRRLMTELANLAKESDRQVIFTTHNPGILDGLNLGDDQQRLFVIERNQLGHTKAKRIFKPELPPGQELVRLSEAFLRGYIGGLPKNF